MGEEVEELGEGEEGGIGGIGEGCDVEEVVGEEGKS